MKEYYSINEKELYNNNYNIDIIENFQIFKGPDGPKGERGYEGIRGLQGLQGERGYKGNMGNTGDRGQKGYQGLEGDQGMQGISGVDGDRGAIGFQGYRGEKGLFGSIGSKGFRGPMGPVGRQGRNGFRGGQGIRGKKGEISSQNISLEPDDTAVGAFPMHGFLYHPSTRLAVKESTINFPDPKNRGNTGSSLRLKYRSKIEAECPYNGYLTGFLWYTNFAESGEYIHDKDETTTGKVSDMDHFNKTNQTGLPHLITVDCKRVTVKFN